MERLKEINENIKNLRVVLKGKSKSSVIELSKILSDIQDARAFIYLLDKIDTERELTTETLENLIENTHIFNNMVIEQIKIISEEKEELSTVDRIFTWNNVKILVIIAVILGLFVSISTNDKLAESILDHYGVKTETNKAQK